MTSRAAEQDTLLLPLWDRTPSVACEESGEEGGGVKKITYTWPESS